LALDEPKSSDKTFDIENLQFLVDQQLLENLGGITIDHVDDGFRSGLTITSDRPLSAGGGKSCGSCKC